MAKALASLDVLSHGRLLFGVGVGWIPEQLLNHGIDPPTRWAVMDERVQAMRAIWTHDEAEYHGRHVEFGPIWSWPKPAQQPHPPILVGGAGTGVIRRVLAYGDEWMPHAGIPVEELGARIRELQHAAREAGRGAEIPVTVQGAEPDARALNELREVGVTRATLYAPSADADRRCACSTTSRHSSTQRTQPDHEPVSSDARHDCASAWSRSSRGRCSSAGNASIGGWMQKSSWYRRCGHLLSLRDANLARSNKRPATRGLGADAGPETETRIHHLARHAPGLESALHRPGCGALPDVLDRLHGQKRERRGHRSLARRARWLAREGNGGRGDRVTRPGRRVARRGRARRGWTRSGVCRGRRCSRRRGR